MRTRNCIERAFGVLKRRLACLSIPVRTKLTTTKRIMMVCAILHNIAVDYRIPPPGEEEPPVVEEEGVVGNLPDVAAADT